MTRKIWAIVLCLALVIPGILIPTLTSAATTSITVTKYAPDGTTILDQVTKTVAELESELPVQGDGLTPYYYQGPTFDPDNMWDPGDTVNIDSRYMGRPKGTAIRDLCELVGGASAGDVIQVKASDNFNKLFDYDDVYLPEPELGEMVVCWYNADFGGYVPSFSEGMRLVFFAETTNGDGKYVFGNWDMHETLAESRWHYFYDGTLWPSSSGISVKYIDRINIYTYELDPPHDACDTTASWYNKPYLSGCDEVSMAACPASDDESPPVEYNFVCENDAGKSSGWQISGTYVATGLTEGTTYTFHIEARDNASTPNQMDNSTSESKKTGTYSGGCDGVVNQIGSMQCTLHDTTHTPTEPAGDNRLALLFVADIEWNDDITGVTYGGQPMTEAVAMYQDDSPDDVMAEIWYIDEAGIQAATGSTMIVTWSDSPEYTPVLASMYLEDVNQTTPIGATDTDGITSAGTVTISPALTNSYGDMALLCVGEGEQRDTPCPSGWTEIYDDYQNGCPSQHFASGMAAYRLCEGGTGVTASMSCKDPAALASCIIQHAAYDPGICDVGTETASNENCDYPCAPVDIYVDLQGSNRPVSGWEVPISVGFFPANSGTLVMSGSAEAIYWFEGTTSGTSTMSGTRAYFHCPEPVAPGTYDITADSSTTLMNVKRNVYIE